MSEEQGRYVRVESFLDEVLVQVASWPAPLSSIAVFGTLALAFGAGALLL